MTDVTRILTAIEQGDERATDELLPLVYEELRVLAAQKLSHERPGQTLQATALVHEAYLRLVGVADQNWQNQSHFFAAAAEAMRRILVDRARHKQSLKGGAGQKRVDLDCAPPLSDQDIYADDLLALDEALNRFAQKEKTKAELVRLRYFAGLTIEQAAGMLNISVATAKRYWIYARAWLNREINR